MYWRLQGNTNIQSIATDNIEYTVTSYTDNVETQVHLERIKFNNSEIKQ